MSNSAYDMIEMVKHDLWMMHNMDSLCAVKETISELLEELEEWEDANTTDSPVSGGLHDKP